MENNDELIEVDIKNHTCYYFDDIIKVEDSDFDNILIDENHTKALWFKTFSTKFCFVQNLCVLHSMKQID